MEGSERMEAAGSPKWEKAEKRQQSKKINDQIWEKIIFGFTLFSALMIFFIFVFILQRAWPVLKESGIGFITQSGFDEQLRDAYWAPAGEPVLVFGTLSLIVGTLATTLGALLLAVPMGVGTAVVISELTSGWLQRLLQGVLRLMAGIPSVIYGLIGLLVVVPFINDHLITVEMQIEYLRLFQLTGNSMLAGIIVLSFMILPVIASLSIDAIRAVPGRYREASLALGLSHWRTILKVVLPAAKSGIVAGVMLGMGRAVGEAIALSMVSGSVGVMPDPAHGGVFFLTPVLPLASAIVNKSQAISVPSIEAVLFGCGVVLLVTTSLLSLCTKVVEAAVKRRQGLEE